MATEKLDFETLLEQSLDDFEMYAAGDNSRVEVRTYILGPPPEIDSVLIKKIREELNATQKDFSNVLGVSRRTVESWEGGRSHPNGSATRLMQLIAGSPSMKALFRQAISDTKESEQSERETTLA